MSGESAVPERGEALAYDWADLDVRDLRRTGGDRRAYDPQLAAQIAQLRKALGPELDATIHRLMENLGISENIRVVCEPRIGVRGPKGSNEMYVTLLALILSSQARKSQRELREQVQQLFPGLAVPKNWNRPLPGFAVKSLREKVQVLGRPYRDIKIREGITLSGLQKAIRTALTVHEAGSVTFEARITITPSALVIGDHRFKVSDNCVGKTKKYCYPEVRLRLADLMKIADEVQAT